jgi:hypothetical protein
LRPRAKLSNGGVECAFPVGELSGEESFNMIGVIAALLITLLVIVSPFARSIAI